VSFLARYSGRTPEAYRHDLRGYFQWAADGAVEVLRATRPHIELFRAWMESRAGSVDDRSSLVDGVWLLPVRAHRWSYRIQPGPVCARAAGPPVRCAWPGPFGTRCVPVHRGPERPRARCAGGAARAQRAAGKRIMRHQHRGPRLRARSSHPADRRQGKQAGDDPARPTHRAHDRSGGW
jgi:hypothetical protein